MKIDIKKKEKYYQDALIWMGYRFAIGLSESNSNGKRAIEQLKVFRDIEFDTPEFHALATEFAQFLERKKIKDVMDLRQKMLESDLIWYSAHYGIGRHSYAASHCHDIIQYGTDVLSPERQEFLAFDIRRELSNYLSWSTPFRMPVDGERTIDPIDAFISFLKDNNIKTSEELAEYEEIAVVMEEKGTYSYHVRKRPEDTEKPYILPFGFEYSDYFGWADLASFFDPQFHKHVLLRNDGKEDVVECFDSWMYQTHSADGFPFMKVKRPVDGYRHRPYGVYIPEEYIVKELD